MSGAAAGRAATKPAPLSLMIAGYMVGTAIRSRLDNSAMGAMVRSGTWNAGVEAIRGEVAEAVGAAFSDEAWERGKVDAWQAYADEQRGVWPEESSL